MLTTGCLNVCKIFTRKRNISGRLFYISYSALGGGQGRVALGLFILVLDSACRDNTYIQYNYDNAKILKILNMENL